MRTSFPRLAVADMLALTVAVGATPPPVDASPPAAAQVDTRSVEAIDRAGGLSSSDVDMLEGRTRGSPCRRRSPV